MWNFPTDCRRTLTCVIPFLPKYLDLSNVKYFKILCTCIEGIVARKIWSWNWNNITEHALGNITFFKSLYIKGLIPSHTERNSVKCLVSCGIEYYANRVWNWSISSAGEFVSWVSCVNIGSSLLEIPLHFLHVHRQYWVYAVER